MVYEWRGEYVRDPRTDPDIVEMILYQPFTGQRVVVSEHNLTPVKMDLSHLYSPSSDPDLPF